MKKKILPLGLSTLIYGIVCVLILGLSLFITLKQFEEGVEPQIWRIIVVWILFLFVLYMFIAPVIMYTISIKDNLISMKKDFGIFEEDRIQYKEEVNLSEVKEFKIILSDKNSKGEPYKSRVSKRKFILFVMNDQLEKRLYVSNLNKKQLVNLVNYIKEKTSLELTLE